MKPKVDLLSLVSKHRIRPAKASPKILESILEDRKKDLERLIAEAQQTSERFELSLQTEDGAAAQRHEKALNDLAGPWKEARLAVDEAQDRYYESHLANRQAEILGSRRRVSIKNGIIFALILLVLSLMAYEYVATLPPQTSLIFYCIDVSCCLVFLVNFFFEHQLALSKRWYWRTHWIDFVTSIPFPPATGAVEGLRSGRAFRLMRLLRLARFARVLRAIRMVLFFWRGMDELTRVLDVRLMKRSLLLCVAVVALGALSIYGLEGQYKPVDNFWDSLWWSFTTTVTGGFGDIHNPASHSGRLLTVFLVIIGMILVGIFTATLTTIMMPEPEDDYDEEQHVDFQEYVRSELLAQKDRQEEILKRLKVLENSD